MRDALIFSLFRESAIMLVLTINNTFKDFDISGVVPPAIFDDLFRLPNADSHNLLIKILDLITHFGPDMYFGYRVVVIFKAEQDVMH